MQTISPIREKPAAAPGASFAYPWIPDQGDGTYRNPVLYADYSDPDVTRVGDDFYLTASSFNCTPGLPILHSRDLVNWTLIGHAVKNLPHPRYDQVQAGCGIWAPSIRFHAGQFWVFFAMPDEGIYLTRADDPAGEWSEPHLVQAGRGLIDPCPLWDDDGKAYLVHAYAHSRSGIKHQLRVRPMECDGLCLLGDGKIVFHDPQRHPTMEGPKFFKKDGWYYILAPAGGVEKGWQVALRSRSIFGPYEDKIVLEQGDTSINGPHQGALVDTASGGWWFAHFQDAELYGRIVHLQPVNWVDGWPIMGAKGEPVLRHAKPVAAAGERVRAPQTSDEFDAPQLGFQWQWQANHPEHWHDLRSRPGWLRLHAQFAAGGDIPTLPNALLQKFPARAFTAETEIEFAPKQVGESAGIVVAGVSCASLALERTGAGTRLVMRSDGVEVFRQEDMPDRARLRVAVKDGGMCHFSFATGSEFVEIPAVFQARAGVWIGAKIGLFSLTRQKNPPAGNVDVDYFRFA